MHLSIGVFRKLYSHLNILIRKALNEYKLTTINLGHPFLALFNPNIGPICGCHSRLQNSVGNYKNRQSVNQAKLGDTVPGKIIVKVRRSESRSTYQRVLTGYPCFRITLVFAHSCLARYFTNTPIKMVTMPGTDDQQFLFCYDLPLKSSHLIPSSRHHKYM